MLLIKHTIFTHQNVKSSLFEPQTIQDKPRTEEFKRKQRLRNFCFLPMFLLAEFISWNLWRMHNSWFLTCFAYQRDYLLIAICCASVLIRFKPSLWFSTGWDMVWYCCTSVTENLLTTTSSRLAKTLLLFSNFSLVIMKANVFWCLCNDLYFSLKFPQEDFFNLRRWNSTSLLHRNTLEVGVKNRYNIWNVCSG